jgi:hypothetical protein
MPLLDGLGKPGSGVNRSPSTRPTAKQATSTWVPVGASDGPAGQTASPLRENSDSRRVARTRVAAVTITPMISAVDSVRPAFRAG